MQAFNYQLQSQAIAVTTFILLCGKPCHVRRRTNESHVHAGVDSLFQAPDYIKHGNMFWPDLWHTRMMQDGGYQLFNLTSPRQDMNFRESESGQFVIDRQSEQPRLLHALASTLR